MPTNITMPALSPTMEEGTLAKWLVKEGDEVRAGDVIAEIETDKATMEVEAVDEGTVGRIVVAEGTEGVKVNAVIAVLLEEGEDASAIKTGDGAGAKAENAGAAPAEEKAKPAPAGKAEPVTAEAKAGKPRTEAKAEEPQKGYGRGEAPEEPTAEEPTRKGDGSGAPAAAEAKAPAAPARDGERIFASPLARRIAKERGIELGQVNGSGPHGRIVKADVEGFEPAKAAPAAAPVAAPAGAAMPMSAFTTDQVRRMYEGRAYSEVTLDGMRRTIATRLTQAKQTIPHFYLRRDVRIDTLLWLRKTMNGQLSAQDVKLSVNDFIIKACAMALMRVPAANAVWAGDRILQFEAADVAVAVAIENGLITPVIRDANAKGLAAISAEMKDLAERARARKLQPQEYMGGSFAISNLGMYGIDDFDAVINPPHASILAVGAGVQRPVVTDGEVGIATIMTVSLSVDHRVIDGALGARFLGAIRDNLENPVMMLV